ncbi:hypothetical protein ATCC90586_007391 [Pythium insidiosum]|nr:hypothetical protein ATCC90586_007391 [Pythium insidiosum]
MVSFRRIVAAVASVALCAMSSTLAAYNVGIGKGDITGPAAEVVMMGWARVGAAESKSTCEWNIRAGNPTSVAGRYRIRHRGFSKSLIGSISAYSGVSATFTVA